MPARKANAVWEGGLADGKGTLSVESGAVSGTYSIPSRFEEGAGTNPEELIGAAHAGCYSMALAVGLSKAGFKPKRIETNATVHIEKVGEGFKITKIELQSKAEVPELDEATFQEHAQGAKTGCPVSQALTGTEILLDAKLI